MDPKYPASFNHRTELLSTGRRYHFVDQLPASYDPATTTTLVCIHGFPDFWYGWRNQIKPWVELGYRVIAVDKLGYGGSDKPEDAAHYTSRRISDDIAALMDLLQIPKAVIIGHDWGSFMASRFALWHPDRLLALVLLSVPFIRPAKEYMPLETQVERYPNWGYQLFFQEKSTNGAVEKQLSRFFRLIFRVRKGTEGLSRWTLPGGLKKLLESPEGPQRETGHLTQQEHEHYLSQFANSMNGPLNYYRTTRYRFEEETGGNIPQAPRSDLPVLLIVGKDDPTSNQAALGVTKKLIPQVQIELMEGVGHWVMLECTDHINESIPKFLRANSIHTKL